MKGKKRILRVDTGELVHVLQPDDKLVLTHRFEGETGGIKGTTSVTISYVWDGETLKRVFV